MKQRRSKYFVAVVVHDYYSSSFRYFDEFLHILRCYFCCCCYYYFEYLTLLKMSAVVVGYFDKMRGADGGVVLLQSLLKQEQHQYRSQGVGTEVLLVVVVVEKIVHATSDQ